jgi:molybdate transport system substrate-binding protein
MGRVFAQNGISIAFGLGLAMAVPPPISVQVPANTPRRTPLADAKPGDLRVIASAAIRLPLDGVLKQAEAALGKKVVVKYGSARGNLKDEILNGQDFEVALLLPDVDEALVKAGKILSETHEIARVPIAFGLRGDAPQLDVSTPDAVKATLVKAKSVKYSPTGAALLTVKKILTDLQIGDQIKNSSTRPNEVPLGPGEYEINIYPLSEIIPNTKLKNLGAVIPALQVPSVMEASIGAHATDVTAARALIRFLQGPAIDAGLKENGMVKSVVNGTPKL